VQNYFKNIFLTALRAWKLTRCHVDACAGPTRSKKNWKCRTAVFRLAAVFRPFFLCLATMTSSCACSCCSFPEWPP